MKKSLLLSIVLLGLSGSVKAQEPMEIDDVYCTYISQNGRYLANFGGNCSIYDIKEKNINFYQDCGIGLGNSVSNDGIGVGDRNGYGVILSGEDAIVPMPLRTFWLSGINAITSDGSRITGYVNNPEVGNDNGIDFTDSHVAGIVPFYCDIDADGNVGEVHILPYPEKDFMGLVPQLITAIRISDDGKCIVGMMTDNYGRSEVPIVYIQEDNGEWAMYEPTKPLYNPDGVVLPPDPWKDAPDSPTYEDYMSPLSYSLYLRDLERYEAGAIPEEPNPFDYMDEDEQNAYAQAIIDFFQYMEDHKAEFDAYEEAFVKILSTSPTFLTNEIALKSDGTQFAVTRVTETSEDVFDYVAYIYDIPSFEYKTIASPYGSAAYPAQILSDGTVVTVTGMQEVGSTYLLFPDSDKYMTFTEYFKLTNPQYAGWMSENLPYGAGRVNMNDNMSVIAGSVLYWHFPNPDVKPVWETYIFTDAMNFAGVEENKIIPEEDFYIVYNIQGLKVLETKDRNAVNSLNPGLYIVNGKKVYIK